MDSADWPYIILFISSSFLASISQIMLKKSAKKTYKSQIHEYINPIVIFAYFIFLLTTFLTMLAYRKIPLSIGVVFDSFSYVFISILSYFFLNEKLKKPQILGIVLIVLGTIIYGL